MEKWRLPSEDRFPLTLDTQAAQLIDWLRVWFLTDVDMYILQELDPQTSREELLAEAERLALSNVSNHRKALFEATQILSLSLHFIYGEFSLLPPHGSLCYPYSVVRSLLKADVTLSSSLQAAIKGLLEAVRKEILQFQEFHGVPHRASSSEILGGPDFPDTQAAARPLQAQWSSSIELHGFESTGRGVLAREDIPAGQPLVTVPESSTISLWAAVCDPAFSEVACTLLGGHLETTTGQELWAAKTKSTHPQGRRFVVEPEMCLLLYILDIRRRLPERFKRWMDLLPEPGMEPSYLLVDNDHLKSVPHAGLGSEVVDTKARLEVFREWCLETLCPLWPEVFVAPHMSSSLFFWAKWILESRAFEIDHPPPPAIVAKPTRGLFSDDLYTAAPETPSVAALLAQDRPHLSEEPTPHPLLPALEMMTGEESDPYSIPQQVLTETCLGRVLLWLPRKLTVVVPMIDMFNHHPAGQLEHPLLVHRSSSELVLRGEHMKLTRVFTVRSPALIQANQQVFLSYGPHQSWEMTRYYCFCPQAATLGPPSVFGYSQCDTGYPDGSSLTLSLPQPAADDEEQQVKLALMADLGMTTEHLLFPSRMYNHSPRAALQLLTLLLSPVDQVSNAIADQAVAVLQSILEEKITEILAVMDQLHKAPFPHSVEVERVFAIQRSILTNALCRTAD
ncbi:MAG: uncharacterized protein KVP18_003520 [Porospora cf. gigantea A]|nr:MAG: hypothetical protein KVP18_003520 [Porospora cf. gigantea A]